MDSEFIGNNRCDYPGCQVCNPGRVMDGEVLGKNQYPDVLTGQVPVSGNDEDGSV
jgi:hypothetical protein